MYSAVPTPVESLSATAANSSVITVNWLRPAFQNGPITHYNVYYREGNISQTESIMDTGFNVTIVTAPMTTTNVTGLKPYTNYTIHVRAIIAAEELQNVEVIIDDLIGDVDVEVVNRTHGDIPMNRTMLDQPRSGPTSTTIQIDIPDIGQIDTGYVL